mgnify:CR=1 FL=1|tara:strand:- start:585 stop:902 length:318 start_codon:yes stop_codon:yes gene_type:complete
MEEVLDLFGEINNSDDYDDNELIPKNEYYYIAETLRLIKDANDYPLFIYSMIKTLLSKKDLLSELQVKEIANILNIKPEVKEVIKIKEKIVYKEHKSKLNNYDDY